jgi:hypothetical protein
MLTLPGQYSLEVWKRGGSNPKHKKFIGKSYVSWSTCESFNDKSGFNTGLLGEFEWMLNKLSGVDFGDMGWGQFGSETEAYITLRNLSKKALSKIEKKVQKELQDALINFTDREKAVLDTIKPLGVFQTEICYYVEELDIIVLGYIDDHSPVVDGRIKTLRDYKTKSESSKKDLHADKKHQIELYILGLRQQGYEVDSAEYCIIERFGGRECMNGGGRESLSIGERVWYEPYTWTEDRLKQTHAMIIDTAKRISSINTTYQKYFGKKE